jgi:hypothetical protein
MSVVVEVQELVTPLCNDTESIFEKGNNDEESADGWEISANDTG